MDSMRGALAFVFAAASLMAADLAPTGTLRAAFLGANPVQGHVDAQTGAITGPVADIVKEMARKLGVPYTIIPASGAAGVIALLKSGKADIGFLAYDEARSKEVDFAGPYALMYNTYVVAADSPIQKAVRRGPRGRQNRRRPRPDAGDFLEREYQARPSEDLRIPAAAARAGTAAGERRVAGFRSESPAHGRRRREIQQAARAQR